MPNINLRLTAEQHAELEAWAHDGHRSIQKEIIWRLFTIEGSQAPKVGPAANEPRVGTELHPGTTATLDAEGVSFDSERGRTARPTVDQEWLARRAGKKK